MTGPIARGEPIATQTFGPFQASDLAAYAEASGDDNPLHHDPAIAAKAGLDRPPVHGMLIVGCFETFLREWRPEVSVARLSAKFIRPLLVGEGIDVAAKVVQAPADAPAVVRLTVKKSGSARDIVCLAEAFVRAAS